MGAQVLIAPSARNDLRDIVAFAALHNPDAAERLGFALIARAESLAQFPERGRVLPEYGDPRLREVLHLSYRVIYRLKEAAQTVEVVRFWHAARGFPTFRPFDNRRDTTRSEYCGTFGPMRSAQALRLLVASRRDLCKVLPG